MDYVGDDGYVYKHNGKEYYKTNISLQGPKGNPGPKGRDGYTPRIGENGNWYIAGTDTRVLSTPNLKVTETELKELVENKELIPGIIYSYNVQTPEETTITINQKAISGSKLETEGVINSNDENYDGKNVLYDITEEKLNIPSEGLVILIAYDNSKIYMYYDGVLENTYINGGPLTGHAEYTLFKRIDDGQFLALNLSSTDYIAANSSNIPSKYNIHTCPRIKLSYDFDTHKDIIIYTKKGNQIEIDIDSLKQLIAENKLEPGVEYVYKINDLSYETTIKQKAISNNKLDTKGKIVNVDYIVEHLKNSTIGINVKKYINSNVVFDIEKDFCLYFNDITYLYIDGVFRRYRYGIVNYEDNWFKVDVDVNVNTLSATVVSDGGNADFSTGSVIGEEYLMNKTIIARPLLTLYCPANHISSIYIDQSYTVDPLHVLVTGDIAVEKDDNGNVIIDANMPVTKSPDVNVISWIREHTDLVCRRYDYDLGVMRIKPATDGDNRIENICMRLPKFWWKSTMIDDDHCQVDFCNEEKYVDDSWHCWEGNTLIDSRKITAISINDNMDITDAIEDDFLINGSGNRPNDYGIAHGKLSVSSVNLVPIINVSQKEFKKASRDTCPNLSLITYESHKIMALLFYAFYGDVDAQKICGNNGGTNEYSFSQNVGLSDILRDTRKSDNSQNNIFWHLIDWWGNCNEYVDNLVILSNHGTAENSYYEGYQYSEVGVLDYEGKIKRIIKVPDYDEGSTKMILGENFDLLPRVDGLPPSELNGGESDSSILAWSDGASANDDPGCVALRSGSGSGSISGVAYLDIYFNAVNFNQYFGSRLQYSGPMVEVDSF